MPKRGQYQSYLSNLNLSSCNKANLSYLETCWLLILRTLSEVRSGGVPCWIHCHSLPGLMPILDPAGRGYCQIWTNHKVGLKTLANDKARGLMRRTWPGLRHWSTTNCPGHANLTSNRVVASLNRRRPCNWLKENISFALAVLVYSLATHFISCIADQGPAFLIILDISYVAIFFFDI